MEQELCRWSAVGAVTVVLQALKQSHAVMEDLSRKVRLSVYQSIYCHEFWIMTEIMRF